jgi:uncharacterized protein with FMN-binding domain
MRRSPIVLAATVAGTAGVLAFHAHPQAAQSATPASSPVASPSSTPGSGTGSGSSGSSTTASGTATGNAVDTRYGAAQVRVTVKSGKVTRIEAVALQGNDQRSVQISSSAEPILQQEALTKQGADIDAVSGATFTSASYAQSLQSGLDKLGFKTPDGSRATLQVP